MEVFPNKKKFIYTDYQHVMGKVKPKALSVFHAEEIL